MPGRCAYWQTHDRTIGAYSGRAQRAAELLRAGELVASVPRPCMASVPMRPTRRQWRGFSRPRGRPRFNLASYCAAALPGRLDAWSGEPDEALLPFGPPLPAAGAVFQLSEGRDMLQAAARLFAGHHWVNSEGRRLGLCRIAPCRCWTSGSAARSLTACAGRERLGAQDVVSTHAIVDLQIDSGVFRH